MALVLAIAKFNAPAPDPSEIVKMASEIIGLPIQFQSSENIPDFNLYAGEIFFQFIPEEKIQLYSYREYAIKEQEDKIVEETGYESPFTTEGYNDCNGVQRVYVRGILGQEMTLLNVITIALKKLGGELEETYDELSEYDCKITEEELLQRVQKYYKEMKPIFIRQKILNFISLPFIFLFAIISTPYFIFIAYKKLFKQLWRKYY